LLVNELKRIANLVEVVEGLNQQAWWKGSYRGMLAGAKVDLRCRLYDFPGLPG
jgi:hypothetical protein